MAHTVQAAVSQPAALFEVRQEPFYFAVRSSYLASLWGFFTCQFDFDIAQVRSQSDSHELLIE